MNVMMMSPTSRRYQDLIKKLGQLEYDRTHLYMDEMPRSRQMEEMIIEAIPYKALVETEADIKAYNHPSFDYDYLLANDATDETNLVSQVANYAIEKDELKKQRMGRQILDCLVNNMLAYGKSQVEGDIQDEMLQVEIYEPEHAELERYYGQED